MAATAWPAPMSSRFFPRGHPMVVAVRGIGLLIAVIGMLGLLNQIPMNKSNASAKSVSSAVSTTRRAGR